MQHRGVNVTERRTPDWKTWLYRLAAGAGISFCAVLLSVIVFLGRGWAESWMLNMNTQMAEIQRNTADLPSIRVKVDTMWQAFNTGK